MTARRRDSFVPAPRDYTPETVHAAPLLAAVVGVVVGLMIIAALAVYAVVIS